MSKMTCVQRDDHSAGFLESQVASGRFASTSDAVGEAVRLMEERDKALEELRALIDAGDASGYKKDFGIGVFMRDLTTKSAA